MKILILLILFFSACSSDKKKGEENIATTKVCHIEKNVDQLLKSILEESTEIKPILVTNTIENFPPIIQLASPVDSDLDHIDLDEKTFYFKPIQKGDKSKRFILEIRKNTCDDGEFVFKVLNHDFGRSFSGRFRIEDEKWLVNIISQSDIN